MNIAIKNMMMNNDKHLLTFSIADSSSSSASLDAIRMARGYKLNSSRVLFKSVSLDVIE